jgi:hypothetical protein
MGRKGTSIRKPKKARPFSNANITGSNTHTGERSSVQTLVQERNAPVIRDSVKPSGGSNKKHNK